jgi:hypothetical protein
MREINTMLGFMLILLLLICGCNLKSYSIGDFETIVVFSDSLLLNRLEPVLGKTFDQYIYTPHSEKSYYLRPHPLQDFNELERSRNLLFLGLLNGDDPVSVYIQKILSPEVQDAIKTGEIFYIFKEDLFAYNQMSIFLAAEDTITLYNNIDRYSQDIFEILEKYNFKRLSSLLYIDGRQEKLEEYLGNTYGFTLKIPLDYYLIKETPDSNFIWLKRLRPDRNFVVYRYKSSQLPADENRLFNLRDNLSYVHFEGDSVNREESYLKLTTFNKQKAVKLIGVWENFNPEVGGPIGGPFRTYVFADTLNRWVYFIDISVTAPGKLKKPFLDQLEVLAASFCLVSD